MCCALKYSTLQILCWLQYNDGVRSWKLISERGNNRAGLTLWVKSQNPTVLSPVCLIVGSRRGAAQRECDCRSGIPNIATALARAVSSTRPQRTAMVTTATL